MADLNELDRAETIKIAGANPSTGVADGFVNSDSNGNLFTKDALLLGGQNRNQAVTTTASEALGAASILTNRKVLTIRPIDGTVYWGYTSGVTSFTGTPILKNELFSIAATETAHIYLVASSGTVNCRVSEGA